MVYRLRKVVNVSSQLDEDVHKFRSIDINYIKLENTLKILT